MNKIKAGKHTILFCIFLSEKEGLQLPLKTGATVTVSNVSGQTVPRVAAALVNVRSPYVAVLVLGTVNEMVDLDRSECVSLYMDSRSLR